MKPNSKEGARTTPRERKKSRISIDTLEKLKIVQKEREKLKKNIVLKVNMSRVKMW
jgi:hypothetical protein